MCSVNDVLLSTWAVSVPPEQKSPFCRYRRDNFYQSKPNGRNSANEGKRRESEEGRESEVSDDWGEGQRDIGMGERREC